MPWPRVSGPRCNQASQCSPAGSFSMCLVHHELDFCQAITRSNLYVKYCVIARLSNDVRSHVRISLSLEIARSAGLNRNTKPTVEPGLVIPSFSTKYRDANVCGWWRQLQRRWLVVRIEAPVSKQTHRLRPAVTSAHMYVAVSLMASSSYDMQTVCCCADHMQLAWGCNSSSKGTLCLSSCPRANHD